MPVQLDTEFLGLWLDEELLREEFDAIIEASWTEGPIDRRVTRPRAPLPHRMSPGFRRRHHGGTVGPPASTDFDTAPARERGPPARS